MLTNELITDLQEKISLARLASETSIKVDVKTLVEIIDALSEKSDMIVTLDQALENMKNTKDDLV